MRKYLFLFLVGLLVSCGGNGAAIPVSEAQALGDLTTINIPLFDYNGDGFLRDEEYGTFSAWRALQETILYPAPTVGEPMEAK